MSIEKERNDLQGLHDRRLERVEELTLWWYSTIRTKGADMTLPEQAKEFAVTLDVELSKTKPDGIGAGELEYEDSMMAGYAEFDTFAEAKYWATMRVGVPIPYEYLDGGRWWAFVELEPAWKA